MHFSQPFFRKPIVASMTTQSYRFIQLASNCTPKMIIRVAEHRCSAVGSGWQRRKPPASLLLLFCCKKHQLAAYRLQIPGMPYYHHRCLRRIFPAIISLPLRRFRVISNSQKSHSKESYNWSACNPLLAVASVSCGKSRVRYKPTKPT